MSANMTAEIRAVSLAALTFSATRAQTERREHFDKAGLTELAASIKSHGLVQPILVRPLTDGRSARGFSFEVVAGERRVLAARQAGLEEITATVRDLTDEQVLELQLIENLQRQDLHELAEAEGYEALQKLGHTVDDMAAKVGKSRGTVYARMKLLALVPEARKAYYGDKLTASVALLLARIPVPELQKQALKEVLESEEGYMDQDGAQPMSYREAVRHIHDNYMLRLKEAPFPTGDEQLVPDAGACTFCPKNTASNTHKGNLELFADVKDARAGVCIDPVCFKTKREAWGRQSIERAEANGQKVITGAEAKQVAKHGTYSLSGGYVKLDERCFDDDKNRTYRQILGKAVQPTLLQVPTAKGDDEDAGQVLEVVKKADVAELLKKKGIQTARESRGNDRYQQQQKEKDKKRKAEQTFRRALLEAIHAEPTTATLSPEHLRMVARVAYEGLGYEGQKEFIALNGWTDRSDKTMDVYRMRERIEQDIAVLKPIELNRFLIECSLVGDLVISAYDNPRKATNLLAEAKRVGINPDEIRKDLAPAAKPKKPAPAKASKKKSRK